MYHQGMSTSGVEPPRLILTSKIHNDPLFSLFPFMCLLQKNLGRSIHMHYGIILSRK